jgi:hypothetical protein
LRTISSCFPGLPAAACVAALLATGCNGIVPPGNNGELNNGVFSYECNSDSDAACDGLENGALGAIPGKIAVAGRFTLRYTASPFGDDENGGSTIVEPASNTLLTQTETFGTTFKALKPGLCAVLARRGDVVADFVHVRIGAVDHLQIDATSEATGDSDAVETLDLAAGDEVDLRAFPVDEADEVLAGALSATWSSSDEQVAAFDSLATDNKVKLRALGAGTAVLRVEIEDQAKEISVNVAGGEL